MNSITLIFVIVVVLFAIMFYLYVSYAPFLQRIKVVTYESDMVCCYPQYKKRWRWHYYYENNRGQKTFLPTFFKDTIDGGAIDLSRRFLEMKRQEYRDRKVKKTQYIYC